MWTHAKQGNWHFVVNQDTGARRYRNRFGVDLTLNSARNEADRLNRLDRVRNGLPPIEEVAEKLRRCPVCRRSTKPNAMLPCTCSRDA